MANTLTSGVKITVDTTELDVKFLKSVDQLNAGLTRSQKALRLFYNENGLLTNSFGLCVEGLSTSQIKLGEYVDELGRTRTYQGGFIEGLNKSQIAMGHYADELGNVYNKLGELIGTTSKGNKALQQTADKTERAVEKLGAAAESVRKDAQKVGSSCAEMTDIVQKGAQGLAGLTSVFFGGNSGVAVFARTVVTAATGVADMNETVKKLKTTKGTVADVRTAFLGVNKAVRLAGTGVGWLIRTVGIAELGIISLGAALIAFSDAGEKAGDENVPEEFKEIRKRAREAGVEVKTLAQALDFGAFRNGASAVSEALAELDRLETSNLTEEQARVVEKSWCKISKAINNACFQFDNFIIRSSVAKEKQEQFAKINGYVEELKEARATETDRLSEKIDTLTDLINSDKVSLTQRYFFENELEQTRRQLKEAFGKNIGVSFEVVPTATKAYADSLQGLTNMYVNGTASVEERLSGEEQLGKRLAKSIEEEGGTREAFADAQRETIEAYLNGKLSYEGYLKVVEELTKTEEEALKRRRAELESQLGVKFDVQTAQEEYAEKLKTLSDRIEEDGLSEKDVASAREQLATAYAERVAKEAKSEEDLQAARAELKNQGQEANAKASEALAAASEALKNEAIDAIPGLREALDAVKRQDEASEAYAKGLEKAKEGLPQVDSDLLGDESLRDAIVEYGIAVSAATEAFEAKLADENTQRAMIAAANEKLAAATSALAESRAENERREAEERKQAEEAQSRELGIDRLKAKAETIESAGTSEFDQLKATYEGVVQAWKDGEASQRQLNEATKAWKIVRADHARQEKQTQEENKRKEKDDLRSKLGVDSLMESLKTPLQKYREAMDLVERAAKKGAIAYDERLALESKATDDYWKAQEEAQRAWNDAAGEAVASRPKEPGRSYVAGSTELYLAQVKNSTASFQTGIQNTTRELRDVARESLWQSQQTNAYLETMATNNVSVWG